MRFIHYLVGRCARMSAHALGNILVLALRKFLSVIIAAQISLLPPAVELTKARR